MVGVGPHHAPPPMVVGVVAKGGITHRQAAAPTWRPDQHVSGTVL
jgi:hypothetical protein